MTAPKEEAAEPKRQFIIGDRVRKSKGSSWQGTVVGFYSTELTPVGYCVESEREPGSVQIYPEAALDPMFFQPSGEVERMRQQLEEAREAHESLKELTIKRSARMDAAESKALMLEADLWDAREALKPFAKLGALFLDPDNQATKGDDRLVWGYNSIDLTYGDFRRAFAALSMSTLPHETDTKPHTPAE